MAEDPEFFERALKPVRELVLNRRLNVFPYPQLLKSSSRVQALNPSVLPKIEGNLKAAAAGLPQWFTGPIQGVTAEVLPELDVMASRAVPYFGRLGSPEFLQEIQEKKDFLLKAEGANRNVRNTDRMARRIFGMMRNLDPEGIGYIIRAGLAQPGIAPTPIVTRDAMILGSFLMSGIAPPEAATWSRNMGKRQARQAGVQAVRLGLEAIGPEKALLGASSSETARRLDIMHGTRGFGNMLAAMGMQQPKLETVPGMRGQEQILGRDPQKESLFTRTFRERLEENVSRVERSFRQVARSAEQSVVLKDSLKKSLFDTIEHVFFDPDVPEELNIDAKALKAQGKELAVRRPEVLDYKSFSDNFDKLWSRSSGNTSAEKAKSVIAATINRVRNYSGEGLERDIVGERLKYLQTTLEQNLGRELSKKLPKLREPGKILRAGIPGEIAEMRMAPEVRQSLAKIGFKPGVVPAMLVSILAAGLIATGLSRGEEAA